MTQREFYKITEYIGSIIKGTTFENHVFAVGGSVRDLTMGNDIKDIDLVIDLPDGGVNFANWCKDMELCHSVVIYETYGTAMFKFTKFPDEEIECVMTRGEKYLDSGSRNPEVTFNTIEEDCIRRDLTINALYYNCSNGEIMDMVGGQEDIRNHVIKITNSDNVDSVIIDDPLRICRIVRFSCKYGWKIEQRTFNAMKRNVRRLSIITKERIRDEFNKILMCRNAEMGIRMLHNIGAMEYIVPEFDECFGMEQNAYHFGDVAKHTLAVLDYHCKYFRPDLTERIACFLHDIGKVRTRTVKDGNVHFYDHEYVGAEMAGSILRTLKYDNDTINEVQFLIRNHMRTKQGGNGGELIKDKSLNKLIYDCKTFERFKSLMRVIESDNMSHKKECCIHDQYEGLFMRVKGSDKHMKMFGYRLPVTGDDIMTVLDIKPSPIIAEINKRLLNKAFLNPDITKEECIKILPGVKKEAEQYIKTHRV